MLMCGLFLVAGVTAAIFPAAHSKAPSRKELATRVEKLEKQLASNEVAFFVQFKNDDGENGIHLGQGSTLKFDNVITNLGDGYNPLTGIFTAPVAGLYVFSLTAMATNGRDQAELAIVMQGTDLAHTWGGGKYDIEDQSTKTFPTHLNEGDQVWVAQRLGDGVRGSWWTTFSGFLVQAD